MKNTNYVIQYFGNTIALGITADIQDNFLAFHNCGACGDLHDLGNPDAFAFIWTTKEKLAKAMAFRFENAVLGKLNGNVGFEGVNAKAHFQAKADEFIAGIREESFLQAGEKHRVFDVGVAEGLTHWAGACEA
jgi:hypothetical protein